MSNIVFTKEAADYARDNLDLIRNSMTAEQREATREMANIVHRFITVAETAAPNEAHRTHA